MISCCSASSSRSVNARLRLLGERTDAAHRRLIFVASPLKLLKAVTRMRSDVVRFRARGLRSAAELDQRARDFLTSS